jgi:hypothetical protein
MNIKYSYRVHIYDTRGSHDLHVSYCTTSVYQNCIFNMDKKSYNKLLEKIKCLHSIVLKEGLKWLLLQNSLYTVEEYI